MNNRQKWRWMGGAPVVAALLLALGWGGAQVMRTEVQVAAVERGTAVSAVSGVVTLTSFRTVELRSETGGEIVESRLELGGEVFPGDWALWLDDTDVRRALERVTIDLDAEAALAEVGSLLRHDLEEARDELTRREGEPTRFSAKEIEQQRRRVARLSDEIRREEIAERRRIAVLRNEFRRLERELEKTMLHSPVAGDVVELMAHPGDVVVPRAVVARILSRERVIEATLSEENFAGVRVGQPATVRFLGYGSRLFPGTVSKVLPAADPMTQRYTVHLEVDMPEELMAPGITGEVSIIVGERADALTIPRRALLGREVFVVRGDRVEAREVTPGFVSLNRVEILAGLEDGERVVVENLDRLRDGDRIRIK